MRQRFAGVDVSTHRVAVAVLDPATNEARTLQSEFLGGNVANRMETARRAIPRAGDWKDVALAAFEDPMSHGFGVSKSLGIFTGMIMAHVPLAVPILRLPPEEWKQACGLRARADKPEVKAFVLKHEPSSADWSFDLCDAYSIAYAAIRICDSVIS